MVYGDSKICRAAPLVLSLMQLLSTMAECLIEIRISNAPITHEFIVWFIVCLSPILVLLLARHVCFLVGLMAVPMFAIFFARIHYTSFFLKYGPTALPQMGDWAIWLNSSFGLFSVIIIAGWAFVRATIFLIDFSIRVIASFRKTEV